MALFRRTDRTAGRISALWEWWAAKGRARADASTAGADDGFAAEMSTQLRRLGALTWSIEPGETSDRVLVISSSGDPALRGLARRIVLAAPDPDERWSYTDTRPLVPDPEDGVLELPGLPGLDLHEVRVAARLDGTRFDVLVHHPRFAEVPEADRSAMALLLLDRALGEVDTELWVGAVHAAETPPLDGFGLLALRAVVQDHQRRFLDEDGRPSWVLLQGETPTGAVLAAARVPLHPLTAPLLDTYVAVVLPYVHRDDDGLPRDDSLEALRELTDQLQTMLGAHGMVVAHQSVAGVRTLHVYVDSTADVIPGIRELVAHWDQGPAAVHDQPDPGWDSVRHFRG